MDITGENRPSILRPTIYRLSIEHIVMGLFAINSTLQVSVRRSEFLSPWVEHSVPLSEDLINKDGKYGYHTSTTKYYKFLSTFECSRDAYEYGLEYIDKAHQFSGFRRRTSSRFWFSGALSVGDL